MALANVATQETRRFAQDDPIVDSALIAFAPRGEPLARLAGARQLAADLGFAFHVIEGPPPEQIAQESPSSGVYFTGVYARRWVDRGYILVSRRRPEVIGGDLSPFLLRQRIRLAQVDEIVRYYLALWPIILGITAISVVSGTRLAEERSRWALVTNRVVVAALLFYLPIVVLQATQPGANVLIRDAVVAFVMAGGVLALTRLLARVTIATGGRPPVRVLIPLAIGIALVAVSPLVIIAAHCTSGDCL